MSISMGLKYACASVKNLVYEVYDRLLNLVMRCQISGG